MKRRKKITHTVRDKWIEDWKRENQLSPHYVSFIKTQDIKSYGSKSRTPDFAESRQDRDLLSTNERHFFYRLRFSMNYALIFEQYPLLSVERAMAIAKKLGVRYPTYPFSSNVPIVMTSDFYCVTISGRKVVYAIKDEDNYLAKTETQRQNEDNKLKIEKAFWESQGVSWHLIRSSELKNIFTQNLEQLFSAYTLEAHYQCLIPIWLKHFAKELEQQQTGRLHEFLERVAKCIGMTFCESIQIFQHCVWHRKILMDLSNQLIQFEKSVEDLKIKVALHD
ncbi:TnsA endonuclease N-terminal domain-containing protein [Vibrio barjaei]|uniref:TnsA endonuclease N-terminal domain-containing protein n=1 Tax=Vibrio barjaei TaxID=1676683 RepID=UPI002283DE51|nr:TnsA endonuclease N-terminal domain-containing protein [Vibrio barjaei]MCY9870799.1 TnsA endonuclease N-terminal domain-containing protein [Vibrio barjaei]